VTGAAVAIRLKSWAGRSSRPAFLFQSKPESTMNSSDLEMSKGPIEPIELKLDDTIQFRCHKGIACFNKCCENMDISLTPYDNIRLKNRLGMSSKEFVAVYTAPFQMDAHGMPGLKLITKPGTTACAFLKPEGCSVYEDRPEVWEDRKRRELEKLRDHDERYEDEAFGD
jgi:Fe-S-cluster containining protein